MPTIKRDYVNVTPDEGVFVGTEFTFQETYFTDKAKTAGNEKDPNTIALLVTHADDTTATPTASNPSLGVFNTIVSLLSGITVVRFTATDPNSNDLITFLYVRTSD